MRRLSTRQAEPAEHLSHLREARALVWRVLTDSPRGRLADLLGAEIVSVHPSNIPAAVRGGPYPSTDGCLVET
jgi:hypothetical protein